MATQTDVEDRLMIIDQALGYLQLAFQERPISIEIPVHPWHALSRDLRYLGAQIPGQEDHGVLTYQNVRFVNKEARNYQQINHIARMEIIDQGQGLIRIHWWMDRPFDGQSPDLQHFMHSLDCNFMKWNIVQRRDYLRMLHARTYDFAYWPQMKDEWLPMAIGCACAMPVETECPNASSKTA